MALVCPQCSKSYERSVFCPDCRVRLLYESKGPHRGGLESAGMGAFWMNHAAGRILAGIFLAQGMSLGLQLLFNAGLQAVVENQPVVWSTLFGLVLLQTIQGISLLAGGALAGAGQRNSFVLGTLVGLAHGVIFLVFQHLRGEAPTEVALYGQPLLHIAFGALGAVIGGSIWRPLPLVAMPEFEAEKLAAPTKRESSFLTALRGPVAWGRVFAGIVIVVAGFLWGPGLLTHVLDASRGKLRVNDHLQAQLVTWEIIGLTTLLGAAIAGATTSNGLKQGLCVGGGAVLLLVGNYLGGKSVALEQVLFISFSIIGLTIAGGWFGGQLFPPIAAVSRRRFPT